MTDDDNIRKQLGAFLRVRRQNLKPQDVGLHVGLRRRTPGLRREELALIAGVSHTWYMHLEQGRDIHPSTHVLRAIGRALKLTEEEQAFIESLAGLPARKLTSPQSEIDEKLWNVVAKMMPWPAILADYHLDVIAQNAAADRLLPLGDAPRCGGHISMLYNALVDPRPPRFLVDWESAVRRLLGQFRAEASRHPNDPRFAEITDRLMAESADFRRLWSEFPVRAAHPAEGTLLRMGGRIVHVDMQELSMSGAANRRIHVMFPWSAEDASALEAIALEDA
ncbi:helix-turn-helix transcriptional regulator [Ramlibacter sp. WS9]|uniref:helix-turn-helix transcriptional regulator n=1 Tax=Ramlibacter sp. WS9 TaxID=1882741 RepID=UPI0011446C4E|nr:helix-turn-helix transcriptional regulator [Ramlibacter sp. WS9]ROZ71322.1 XRE family transcriptional regulator [Ramlibacter sp. WS9]